ncbi:Glyoxalase I-Like;11 [Hibiscus trionum]|uniref:Glyoxalase I-Like11 n=1 Tax=Hibiscus trionum TaxID=183268 RepID=A0A9W7ILJ3_HIBTR|nr:Glyoxalase I-Like;11 [Hibiscus trionum]
MASLLSPSAAISLQHKLNRSSLSALSAKTPSKVSNAFTGDGRICGSLNFKTKATGSVEGNVLDKESASSSDKIDYGVVGMHHVGILCENLERSLEFYQNILGLEINEARPHDKLPYRGAWLWVGSEMIHLMELPNPDPLMGRPEHGGRDRHACISIRDVSKLQAILDKAGIPYTLSRSGRPAIFTRDPDANALEFTQV